MLEAYRRMDKLVLPDNWDRSFYIITYRLVAMRIVDGEVVSHMGVDYFHGHCRSLVVRLMSHRPLQTDDGTVVLYFH